MSKYQTLKELKNRKNLDSFVIPNVFDFDENKREINDYNRDFREKLGIRDNDILILQATRVTNQKAKKQLTLERTIFHLINTIIKYLLIFGQYIQMILKYFIEIGTKKLLLFVSVVVHGKHYVLLRMLKLDVGKSILKH